MSGVRPQPLIAVRDVRASSRWYAALLGARRTSEVYASDHDHLYDRLLCDGELVLQLHAWDAEDHPNLVDRDRAPVGHGVLLWFELDDFDTGVARARALGAEMVEEPHVNPAPGHRECWLRDPDGYLVVICSPDGEARYERSAPDLRVARHVLQPRTQRGGLRASGRGELLVRLPLGQGFVVEDVLHLLPTSLQRNREARERLDPPIVDVDYHDLVGDPIGTVRRIYEGHGRVLTDEAEAAMRRRLENRPRNKYGVHRYDLADFGLTRDDVRAAFAGDTPA